jgi:hypothetical protein
LRGRETGNDAGAKRPHLIVIGARLVGVHQKIELVFAPVNVSKDLQQPRFHAAAIQSSDNVQNPHGAQAVIAGKTIGSASRKISNLPPDSMQ